jgi:cell division protein FtsB
LLPEDQDESLPEYRSGYRTIRLPQAREGVRRAGAFVLDATEECRPAVTRVFGWRRKLGTAVASVLAVWILFHVLLGANGTVAFGNKRTEYKSLEKDVDQLQTENDQLRKHIEGLQADPAAIEREAREQLHYVKPGEIVYVAPVPPPPPMPKNNAANNNAVKK